MGRKILLWEKYERLVAQMITNQLSTAYCVTPNAFVTGSISGIKRQIDVLIDLRHQTDNRTRIIVDAKMKKRCNPTLNNMVVNAVDTHVLCFVHDSSM